MATKISGSKSLSRKFDKLGDVAKGRTLERAAVAGMLLIINDAKVNAPVESGNLRRSLHIGGHEDLTQGGSIVDSTGAGVPEPEISANRAAVYGGTDVIYAAAQEFGTEDISAQPYLRPAFDSQRKGAVKEVGATLKELIRAVL